MSKQVYCAALVWLIGLFVLPITRANAENVVTVRGPVVVSGHPEATRIGIDVIKSGGNAIDALVATSMALGVAEPGNSGLGGKLVVLYYDAATRQSTFLTALEAAPMALKVDEIVALPAASRARGWQSVCVPGLAAGLGAVHEKWGSRPWSELVKPAAALAREGFILSERVAEMNSEFPLTINGQANNAEAITVFAPGGKHLPSGARFTNPDLATTLDDIANNGWQSFYTGRIAAAIVKAANDAGSPLSAEDFNHYKPRFSTPLKFNYKAYEIHTSPAPLTGGTILAGTLKAIEPMDFTGKAKSTRDAAFIDYHSRVLTQWYPISSRLAGDMPDAQAKIERSLSAESIAKVRSAAAELNPTELGGDPSFRVNPAGAPADARGMIAMPEPALAYAAIAGDSEEAFGCTTHLMIVDAAGNVVVATQSLGWHFGAAVVAPGTGVLMANGMNNFGYTSPNSVNYVAPGKWPRSTIAPTIAFKSGKPFVMIGAAGGQRIPTQITSVLLDVLDFNRPIAEAIREPRYHLRRATARGEPDNVIDFETGFSAETISEIAKLGWRTMPALPGGYFFANVNAATAASDGTLTAVADPRRASDAQGLNITD